MLDDGATKVPSNNKNKNYSKAQMQSKWEWLPLLPHHIMLQSQLMDMQGFLSGIKLLMCQNYFHHSSYTLCNNDTLWNLASLSVSKIEKHRLIAPCARHQENAFIFNEYCLPNRRGMYFIKYKLILQKGRKEYIGVASLSFMICSEFSYELA